MAPEGPGGTGGCVGAPGVGAGTACGADGRVSGLPSVNLTETRTSLNIWWDFSMFLEGARQEILRSVWSCL